MPTPRVWSWEGNSVDPIVEEYGYATDVMESYNGSEQRVALRRHPVGSIEFSFFAESAAITAAGQSNLAEASSVLNALWAEHGSTWIVPLFHLAQKTNAQSNAGSTNISVFTTVAPFRDPLGLGRYVLLWKDSRTYEVAQIVSMTSTNITLFTGLAATWAAGSWCIPCRVGRLGNVVGLRWSHAGLLEGRVKFTFESAEDVDSVPA